MEVGKVYLVGGGIGSIYHLTRRAFGLIQRAEVVVYDRLINQELLKLAPYDAEFIDVGKMPNHHKVTQEEIEDILVAKAREGKQVVRLKAGDPYIFGRGGEEALRLEGEKIPWEVIPGLSSSIVGASFGGIPITFRNKATSFHVVTASLKEGESYVDWEPLAKLEGTLVMMMGVAKSEEISKELIRFGKDEKTPVAIIEWAGYAKQRKALTTLENLAQTVIEKELKAPAVMIIGETVSLSSSLDFFERKPLFGRRIGFLIRPWQHNGESQIAWELDSLGAEIILLPLPQERDSFSLSPPAFWLQDIQVDAIIIPSSKMADEGRSLYGHIQQPLFVLGEKTKEALHSWTSKEVIVSKQASVEALKESLVAYYRGK